MSKGQGAIDFGRLAQEVQDSNRYWGNDKLAIWGGWCCTETDAMALLRDWPQRDKAMPYRIWEYTSEMVFEEKALPVDGRGLERGRLFGPGGDLSLRRDGDRFYWHFVGQPGMQPPDGDFHAQDFWGQAEAGTSFFRCKERSLLWGERQEGFDLWFEDRTGRARLRYPMDTTGRVQVEYQTFSRAGRVEFVWLLGLEAYNG